MESIYLLYRSFKDNDNMNFFRLNYLVVVFVESSKEIGDIEIARITAKSCSPNITLKANQIFSLLADYALVYDMTILSKRSIWWTLWRYWWKVLNKPTPDFNELSKE